ncbi:MAG: TrmH family RNA methyltransferase [Candidatus Saccharimonadales bacterium]
MSGIIVIAHNIRSAHNIGSIFRSADCFGVSELILCGYSPYPAIDDDSRLPHIVDKLTQQIHKTALGTENTVPYSYSEAPPLDELKKRGYSLVALEQSTASTLLATYNPPEMVALIIGEERFGITQDILDRCDTILEIPQYGTKESLNVSVATGICLYHLSQTSYT